MSWSFVVHVHTHRSVDSMSKPEALVRKAVALGIDVLAITDHDTWRGAVEALEVVSRTGAKLRIVIGSEVATDQGDVIGLFLGDDLRSSSAPKFCDQVHEHGGLVVLPHPYKWHRLDGPLLDRVDLVEVFNARTPRSANDKAAALARERGLPELVGPDAHRVSELTLARNEFDGDLPADEAGLKRALLEAPRRFYTTPSSAWDEWRSQVVRLTKQPSPALALGLARGAVRRLVKPKDYALG
jgi:predicted metal-dependent phosphoesterase TrpH